MPLSSSSKIGLLSIACACNSASAQTYQFHDLVLQTGNLSTAVAINNRDQIVGAANATAGGSPLATRWDNGFGQALATPMPFQAVGINDSGQIAGNVGEPLGPVGRVGSTARAALLDPRGLTILNGFQSPVGGGQVPDNLARGTQARGINDRGQVVGYAQTTTTYADYPTSLTTHAALFSIGDAPVDLGTLGGTNSFGYAVNNRSQAVGISAVWGDFDTTPALFSGGAAQSLGGWSAYDINDGGLIVGSSFRDLTVLAPPGSEPVLVQVATLFRPDGQSVYLDNTLNLSGVSVAKAVNESGAAVGYSKQDFYGLSHGTLWANGAQIDLNTFLAPSLLAAGWYIGTANDINDAGSIVGDLYNSVTGAQHGFLLSVSAVPEPGTQAFLIAGGAFVFWRRCRPSRRRSPALSAT